MAKRISAAKIQQLAEARAVRSGNKENFPLSTAHARRLSERLERTQGELTALWDAKLAADQQADVHRRRADRWEDRAEEARTELRARQSDPERIAELESTVTALRTELSAAKSDARVLRKRVNALQTFRSRAKSQKRAAILRAEARATQCTLLFILNRGNFVPYPARVMVLQLCMLGLATEKVTAAVKAVATAAGFQVKGSVSDRTVRRIVDEGGVASEMQLAEELQAADSVTLSSDGTTDHSLQYTAHHAAISKDGAHAVRFIGTSLSENHTVQTQLRDWKGWLLGIADALARSPRGRRLEQIIHDICSRIQGFSSDHSADMKALNSELFGWICDLDRIQRGQSALEAEGADKYAALVLESYAQMIETAGGLAAWDMLSFEDRNTRWLQARESIFRERGRAEFSKLSSEQQDSLDVWFWTGCCMHKELNSVVGGYTALSKFWAKSGLIPPIKLMNKDNSRAASSGAEQAGKQADDASVGGAVKLLQLLAALVRHKDKKKGHQDDFKEFFATILLYDVEFPDVSNTRFQSYCDAAAFVLIHLDLFYVFMEHIRDSKTTSGWNHMERNVWDGLRDIPTQTELAVLAYYGQSIGHPYVSRTRIPGLNALALKPIHDEVKAHCKAIAECPELLTSPLCLSSTGCLGGAAWDRPDVIYCLQYRIQSYPHISGAISAFFSGAYETWVRFTSEYTDDGAIATASKDTPDRVFLPATNDHNEAAVGWLRNFKARHPNATMAFFNAITRCTRNNTVPYIQEMDIPDRRFVTAEARRRGELGRKRLERAKIMPYQRQKVKEKRLAMERAARRKRDLAERLRVLLDGLDRTRCKHSDDATERMTVAQIDAELEWHRHRGAKDAVPLKKELKRKAEKLEALKKAIDAYNVTCNPETEWFGIEEGSDDHINEINDVDSEDD